MSDAEWQAVTDDLVSAHSGQAEGAAFGVDHHGEEPGEVSLLVDEAAAETFYWLDVVGKQALTSTSVALNWIWQGVTAVTSWVRNKPLMGGKEAKLTAFVCYSVRPWVKRIPLSRYWRPLAHN